MSAWQYLELLHGLRVLQTDRTFRISHIGRLLLWDTPELAVADLVDLGQAALVVD